MAHHTLQGITVLDLSSYLAGPFGATLLGDLGANVIKVENPQGDMMRHYPSSLPGESRAFIGSNRNKRGIVIDLKHPEGRATFHRLVEDADVVIHNFRTGVAQRLDIHYERLQQLNPRLLYCALTGFGTTGPMATAPGFDQVLQSFTGISSAQGATEDAPRIVWGSVVDYYASSLIGMSICAALFEREKTGRGQEIDVSLLRTALAMQSGRMVWAEGEDRHVDRDLRGGRLNGIHPTKSGHIYLQAPTQPFWESLCELTGLSHLTNDPRCESMKQRKQHEEELLPILRGALMQRTALEWEALFGQRVPCSAVRGIEDVFDHPQVLAQGLVATHPHPTLGSYRAMTEPVRMNRGHTVSPDRRAPILGEHTDEVLAAHGFTPEAIAALRAAKAVQ